jgi:hypothetical protein
MWREPLWFGMGRAMQLRFNCERSQFELAFGSEDVLDPMLAQPCRVERRVLPVGG